MVFDFDVRNSESNDLQYVHEFFSWEVFSSEFNAIDEMLAMDSTDVLLLTECVS